MTGTHSVREFSSAFRWFSSAPAQLAFAQAGRGGISGLVSDPTGAIIPGASVTAQQQCHRRQSLHRLHRAGLYSFVSLAPGTYEVTTSEKGFETVVRTNVVVTVDQVTTVNITLHVGNVTRSSPSTKPRSLVDTSNSTVGQLISAETIDRVPLLTRNVYDLVQLSAGVTPANGSPNSSSSLAIDNISSRPPRRRCLLLHHQRRHRGLGLLHGRRQPARHCGKQCRRHHPRHGDSRRRRGGVPRRNSEHSGLLSERRRRRHQPGQQIRHQPVPWRCLRRLPARRARRQRVLQQAKPGDERAAEHSRPPFTATRKAAPSAAPSCTSKLFFFGDYEATQQQTFDGSNYFTVPTTAERTGDFSGDGFTIYDPTHAR